MTPTLSGLVIAGASLAGALVFPLSNLGRAAPASASKEWLLLLAVCWALIGGWSLLYAQLLQRRRGFSPERSLYWATVAHTPLLLCLGLVVALYWSDSANHLYSSSPYAPLFQLLAQGYVIAAPAVVQLLRLAIGCRIASLRLLAILLLGAGFLVLRGWNLGWGLPGRFHPDEYATRALMMLVSGDMNPHFFNNPTVMIYAIYALQKLVAPHIPVFQLLVDSLGLPVQDPRGDYLLLLVGRAIGALSGTLTVGVLYLAGKELLGRKAAAVATLLLGVSFLHVRNSHYSTNDVLATFLLTVSFLFSVRVYTRGRLWDYLLAAAVGGLATSTKYTSSLFVLAILAAHFARSRGKGGEPRWKRHLPLPLGAVVAPAAFLAGTPYALLDFHAFWGGFRFQLALGAEAARGQLADPTPLLLLFTLAQGLGLVALLAALLGAIYLLRHDRGRFALLAIIPAVFFLSMSGQRYYYSRFILPLLPFLALFAGAGIAWVASRMGNGSRERLLLPLLATIALAQPIALSVQHNLLLGRPDTRILAAAWIEANSPPDATIAVETHSMMDNPWLQKADPRRGAGSYWAYDIQAFWPEKREEMDRVLAGSFDYVIVTSWGYDSLLDDGLTAAELRDRYQSLDKAGELVARFGPGPGNADIPYAVDDTYTPFWHLFDRERPGPTVKIYRMGVGG